MQSETQFTVHISELLQKNQIEEIIQLIESKKLDPTAPMFWGGSNLYHQTLMNRNLELLKYLHKKKMIMLNQPDQNGNYPLEFLTGQMYEPKAKPLIRYLLDNTDIDTALNSRGRSPGSLTYGIGDSKIGIELMEREPINSNENKVRNIKLTCLKFGLSTEGEFNFESSTLSEKERLINPEGYKGTHTTADIQILFEKYIKETNNYLSEKENKILHTVNECLQKSIAIADNIENDFASLFNDYKEGKMICLVSSAEEHCAAVVIHNDKFYRCNKGLGMLPGYGVGIYAIKEPLKYWGDLQAILNTIYPEKLARIKIEFQNNGLEGKGQYVGNCSMASPKKAIHAMIYDSVLQEYPNETAESQKAIARKLYKQWAAWDRKNQIEKLIRSCSDDKAILISLLKVIMMSGRPHSENHKKIITELEAAVGENVQSLFQEANFKVVFDSMFLSPLKVRRPSLITLEQEKNNLIDLLKKMGIENSLYDIISEKYHLFVAIVLNDNNKLNQLLKKDDSNYITKIGVHSDDSKKMTLLHIAAAADNTHGYCLEAILKKYPTLIEQQNEQGLTPLHIAIMENNVNAVKKLLTEGAELSDLGSSLSSPNRPLFTLDNFVKTLEKNASQQKESKLEEIKKIIEDTKRKKEKNPARVAPFFAKQRSQHLQEHLESPEQKTEIKHPPIKK